MRYFTFQEFERSATAIRHGIDNTIPEQAKKNIAILVDNVLDPLRSWWGKPIIVTSGYRNTELNRLVGGVKNSHHMRGMAADISTGNSVDNRRLFQKVTELGLPFTQLIGEKGFSWLHISLDINDQRKERLIR